MRTGLTTRATRGRGQEATTNTGAVLLGGWPGLDATVVQELHVVKPSWPDRDSLPRWKRHLHPQGETCQNDDGKGTETRQDEEWGAWPCSRCNP